ncbi:carboxypeptidase regulatory-like domain-containing protein [Streptomyces sp. NPDC004542]|uniref:carboxypeptidase regulatory-like domain-containing protein n=1 Tax=Streptomyces sp. NPDC004542 TaxID=3154281 RepID=UPI0033A53DCC
MPSSRRRSIVSSSVMAITALLVALLQPAVATAASARPASSSPATKSSSHPAPSSGTASRAAAAKALTAAMAGSPAARAKHKYLPDPTGKPARHKATRSCATPRRAGEMACAAYVRSDVKVTRAALAAAAAAPAGFAPADLRDAYGVSSAVSGGRTVAIVDAYDSPTAEADLAAYRAMYGLPECTTDNGCFRKINQNGGTSYPSANANWAMEISLDLDMVSAVCPDCKILLVEANSASVTDLGTAVNQAVAQGAQYVSNSWGSNEFSAQLTYDKAYFDHPGVAITASTGDYGYAYGTSWPASSPNVTAVGGTSLVKSTTAGRGWTETTWSGAGSGCSAYEAKPAVQTDTGCTARAVADVSAVSDPNTGVAVYASGAWRVFGGTSAAAPIIASVYALAGAPVTGSSPMAYPYTLPGALNDVTSGSNGTCTLTYVCTAGPGYDGPTGLGTPRGTAAFKAAAHGTVHGTVTDSATGDPVGGASVTMGTLATTTAADGTYTLAVPVGAYDLKAAKFGYRPATRSVSVAEDDSVTADLELQEKATARVRGTVKDGSGHGWPLYAVVRVAGEPTSAVRTDPVTGRFTLEVPVEDTYTVQVEPAYPGYQEATAEVTVADSALRQDFAPEADPATCSAPGYQAGDSGSGSCAVVPGGLVTGQVTDKNTEDGVAGATVGRADGTGGSAVTLATPDDPAVGDGFYTLFAAAGSAAYSASASGYTTDRTDAAVTADAVAPADFTLAAARLSFSRTSIDTSVDWQGTAAADFTVTNTGSATASFSLAEQPGRVSPMARSQSAPLVRQKKTRVDGGPLTPATARATAAAATPADTTPAGDEWTSAPDLPITVADNTGAAGGGKVYSVGGYSYTSGRMQNKVFVYDTATATWGSLPDMSYKREAPQAVYLYGKLYVFGGWTADYSATDTVEIYDTVKKTWTAGARMPQAVAKAGLAVVDGRIYLIGGCLETAQGCVLRTVQVYDPLTDTWSTGTDYPSAGGWYSCGTVEGKIYCAGGLRRVGTSDVSLKTGYVFDPGKAAWSPITDLPATSYASAGVVANGRLLMSGGYWDGSLTNAGYAYDPATDAWTPLPNANQAVARAGAACGMYRLGGGLSFYTLVGTVELLPGNDSCGTEPTVDWMSEDTTTATLAPGDSVKVRLSFDASGIAATQPGIWNARLVAQDDTPYAPQSVEVNLTQKAPATWGKIGGTVRGTACDATTSVIPGALVGIQGTDSEYTLKVDSAGHYQLWLDVANSPLLVTAAKDGWGPRAAVVSLTEGATSTKDFTLKPADGC